MPVALSVLNEPQNAQQDALRMDEMNALGFTAAGRQKCQKSSR